MLTRLSKKKLLLLCAMFLFGVLLILYGNQLQEKGGDSVLTQSTPTTQEEVRVRLQEELCDVLRGVMGMEEVQVKVHLKRKTQSASGAWFSSADMTDEEYEICGVVVLCANGDLPQVQKRVVDLLSALLSLPSHKIFVAQGK